MLHSLLQFSPEEMNYRQLLSQLQKLSTQDLEKMVKVYDYETDTILEDASPGFEFDKENHPFITIN
jgi:hypothetical protein